MSITIFYRNFSKLSKGIIPPYLKLIDFFLLPKLGKSYLLIVIVVVEEGGWGEARREELARAGDARTDSHVHYLRMR